MDVKEFDFDLPEELIAQHPLQKRDTSRLMVLDKKTGEIEHKVFHDIIDYLNEGDTLVLNNTRVLPARLIGEKEGTGGKIEFLLLNRVDKDRWECLAKPGKSARVGRKFTFGEGKLKAEVVEVKEDGNRIVEFHYDGIFEEVLDSLGEMPLPPYIHERLEDRERYQTVYSKETGSAAAPTAGLHFTKELLEQIKAKGVNIAYVTETKKRGNRVITVGTTSTRTLETIGDENGFVKEQSGWTDIFIYPGYKFKVVDNLITNFHLPESTLIMLVSTLAGKENVMNAYREAVKDKYRFFSFGDAMFIK